MHKTSREVDTKFPGLHPSAKEALVKKYLADARKNQPESLQRDIRNEFMKSKDRFQDKRGDTYLMELDCWHWARYVENVLDHGHPGDILKNGQPYDMLMNAPDGSPISWNRFLFYFSALLYRMTAQPAGIELYRFLFYLPVVLSALLVLLAYVFSRRLYGDAGAFIASLFIGLGPIFLPRSSAGWFDMDIFNLLLPFLAVVVYAFSYEYADRKKRLMFLAGSALLIGLFAFTWNWWFFVFFVILFYELYSIADLVSRKIQYAEDVRLELRSHAVSLCVFVPLALFFVAIFSGTEPFTTIVYQISSSFSLNDRGSISIWPNVLSTVGELKRPDFKSISQAVGGVTLFLSGASAMIFFILTNRKYRGVVRESLLILVLWFFVMFLASFKGVRFTMFLLVPLGVFLGFAASRLLAFSHTPPHDRWKISTFALIAVLAVFQLIENGNNASRRIVPLMNDSFYSALTRLRENTAADAIINSWWDFGDWFKTVSRRRVIFDGQSQNSPAAYWMARALLTDDEREAQGILRMLNNGGTKAFNLIDSHFNDPYRSVAFLKTVIRVEASHGESMLKEALPPETAQKVSRLLYDTPPEAYFVVDSTMIGKLQAISYLGNWDFAKVFASRNAGKLDAADASAYLQSLGMERKRAEEVWLEASMNGSGGIGSFWVSRPLRIHAVLRAPKQDGVVYFGNGFVYDPRDTSCRLFVPQQGGYKIPQSLFLIGPRGEMTEKKFPGAELGFSAAIIDTDDDQYTLLLLDAEVVQSMFFRLYFLNGAGLRNFEFFTKEHDRESMSVFKIKWRED